MGFFIQFSARWRKLKYRSPSALISDASLCPGEHHQSRNLPLSVSSIPISASMTLRFSSKCLRFMNTIFTESFMHQYLSTEERMNGAGNGNLSSFGGSKSCGITFGVSIVLESSLTISYVVGLPSLRSPSPLCSRPWSGTGHKGVGAQAHNRY